jgi:hypothetical protein
LQLTIANQIKKRNVIKIKRNQFSHILLPLLFFIIKKI